MAEQVLSSTHTHAEDVGGAIVEPGDPIPAGADPEVLERLEADGALGDAEQQPQTKRGAK
jgi:hypothetical protein